MSFQEKLPTPIEPPIPEEVSSREYLKEEFKPIVACVGTVADFLEQWQDPSSRPEKFFDHTTPFSPPDMSGAWNVKYRGNPEVLAKNGFKNRDRGSYVISPVDNLDKFSAEFVDCTGVLVAGQDKETGENISLMSHQNPSYFLSGVKKNLFFGDLEERLKELKGRCVDRSIDAVILGGNYIKKTDTDSTENYVKSIELLSRKISDALGFEPMVIAGPKTDVGGNDVFYENKNRRVYIAHPPNQLFNKGFTPSKIKKEKRNWR